jgi:hypothetical protein
MCVMSNMKPTRQWRKTLARLRKNAAELRAYDFEVIEPPNVEIPPEIRGTSASGR